MLLFWPGETCESLSAVCLFRDWGPSKPCQHGTGQWFNIFPKLALGNSCPSLLNMLLGYHILLNFFLLHDRSICPDLTWVSSAPLQEERQIGSWTASTGTLLAETETWSSHSAECFSGHTWSTVCSSSCHHLRNMWTDWRESKGRPQRWSKG